MTLFIETCPHCNANLMGGEIPEEMRGHFDGQTHGTRLVGVYDWGRDRTSHFECPDCKGAIARSVAIPGKQPMGYRTFDLKPREPARAKD